MPKRRRLLLTGGRIWNTKQKLDLIGAFALGVVKSKLGGTPHWWFDRRGDLELKRWDAVVEIKASNNNHSYPPIFVGQLNGHGANGNGCRYHLYAIVKYRNRFQNPLEDRLRDCGTVEELRRFLARNIMAVYLFDARVVEALHAKHGTREVQRDGEARPIVNVRWMILKRLAREPREHLRALGLKPRMFWLDSRELRGTYRGNRLAPFIWTSVVHHGLARQVRGRLKMASAKRSAP